jgi:hypothetical protein
MFIVELSWLHFSLSYRPILISRHSSFNSNCSGSPIASHPSPPDLVNRPLLRNTIDCDSESWNHQIFLSLVNISQDLSLFLAQSSDPQTPLPLLLRYSQDVVNTLKKSFFDMNDSLSREEETFIPERYSLFMLEALPKSKSSQLLSA